LPQSELSADGLEIVKTYRKKFRLDRTLNVAELQ
jgi:hypothetical protein